jgi:hypothetical protein
MQLGYYLVAMAHCVSDYEKLENVRRRFCKQLPGLKLFWVLILIVASFKLTAFFERVVVGALALGIFLQAEMVYFNC